MTLKPHPTWEVIDSSKITTYLDCPRRFFFEHVLGWRKEGSNIYLIFGEALHRALEHIEINRQSIDRDNANVYIQEAFNIFLTQFRKEVSIETELESASTMRTAHGAASAIAMYALENTADKDNEVLDTEIAGVVYINQIDGIYYRMDLLARNKDGQIFARDHKSATYFNRQWIDQWALSFQMGTYAHVLYSHFRNDQVWGVEVSGIAFKKSGDIELIRVPVRKAPDQMDNWLWHANEYMRAIKEDFKRLESCSEHDEVLHAFPQNPNSCTKYFGCPFLAFCQIWSNPLKRSATPPIGFVESFLDPRDYQREAKTVIDIPFKQEESAPYATISNSPAT